MNRQHPKQQIIKTLRQLAVINVVENFDQVWCPQPMRDFLTRGFYRFILGPFDDLPEHLCHDVFKLLKTKCKIRKYHAILLVHAYYKSLDCSHLRNETDLILKLIGYRCSTTLTVLHLSHAKYTIGLLKELLTYLESIARLHIDHNDMIGDDIGQCLAPHGKNLQELNLSFTRVSNKLAPNLIKNCPNLQSLNISDTDITDDGAKIILKSLKNNLKEFNYPNNIAVIFNVLREAPETEFKLKSLSQQSYDVDGSYQNILEIAINACPATKSLNILYSGDFPLDFIGNLSYLSEIRLEGREFQSQDHLTLRYFQGNSLPIDHISSVLSILSNTLVKITLDRVKIIDLTEIILNCSKLKYLDLSNILQYNHRGIDHNKLPDKDIYLAHLESVIVRCHYDNELNVHVMPLNWELKQLFQSFELRHILIENCSSFDDEFIKVMEYTNPFHELTSMKIYKCHNICMESLRVIILNPLNHLETIELMGCNDITFADYNSMKKNIKKHNWDIKLIWS